MIGTARTTGIGLANRAARHLVFAALCLLLAARPAGAEQRVALVVGNGAYQHAPRLDNPANDAKLIAATLQQLGFTLVGGGAQLDLDRLSMERAVRNFGRAIGPGTVALFYYSGHGLQIRGTNYLVPVQANLTSVSDVDFELLDADVVVRQMDAAHSSLNLIILDACRNNPFGGRGLRDGSGGLAEMHAPRGTLISYATQPGGVARDGDPGGDSPYSVALASALRLPGVDVFRAFNQVGVKVTEATGGSQVPWLSSSPIEGDFYLASAPAAAPPSPAPPPPAPLSDLSADRDALFWHSIESTNRPDELEAYLKRFPDGTFSDLARSRLALLQIPRLAPPAPIAPAPAPPEPPKGAAIGPAQIGEAQRLLAAMGLLHGPASGRADGRLAEAIRLFQRASDQPQAGVLTGPVLEALRGPPPPASARAGALAEAGAEAAHAGHAGEAASFYEAALRLDPANAEALRFAQEQRRAREVAPPVKPATQRVPAPAPAEPRSRPASLPSAPVSGFAATAADGQGRQYRASSGASEAAAVSGALSQCHASGAGECRIISLFGASPR